MTNVSDTLYKSKYYGQYAFRNYTRITTICVYRATDVPTASNMLANGRLLSNRGNKLINVPPRGTNVL